MKLGELIQNVPCRIASGDPGIDVRGVTDHSIRVDKGFLFAAVAGYRHSGTDYLQEAFSRGAAAILSHRSPEGTPVGCAWVQAEDERLALSLIARNFYRCPDREMTVLGVTGTNGKTTVCHLIESVLSRAGHGTARIGTIAYRYGERTEPAQRTTPSPVDLYRILATARRSGDSWAVLEVSSHALVQKRTSGLRFSAAVFTNLTRDHLDYHGNLEDYFAAKRTLFEDLPPEAPAVVSLDDPFGERIARTHHGKVLTYGTSSRGWCRPEEWTSTREGLRVRIRCGETVFPVVSPLLGNVNLSNLLAAAAVSIALGLEPDQIAAGIQALQLVPGRMERINEGQDFLVLVDYAHSPDALEKVLGAVRDLRPARLICVVGCGGDRDRGKRRPMGRTAAHLSDVVILTSDNPRSEDPASILKEVEAGARGAGLPGTSIEVVPDRREAIATALDSTRSGDAVVIAGKGHETTQELATGIIPFDDRKVVRGLLRSRNRREPTYGAA